MAKSRKLEALLETLKQLGDHPSSDESIAQLQPILASKYAVAVAQAAKLVGKFELAVLMPDLVNAFDRFMISPVETDPNCHAKQGIVDALYRLNAREADLFLKGIRHVQMEPVWGGKVDTAAELRGRSALALVRMNYPDVMTELADLLADPESPARIAAARAIAYSTNEAGIPLLRLRARIGDEPQVVSECLAALLQLAPERSIEFALSFLQDPNPQTQELTALLLGESRLSQAFEPLKAWWRHLSHPELRRTALLAIAMLRLDPPLDFLLTLVETGRPLDAQDAIAALQIYEHDTTFWQRVEAAQRKRGDRG